MQSLEGLLESVAQIIIDYRQDEIPRPTPLHVWRWVVQFPDDVQIPILRELIHVFRKTYLSKEKVLTFLTSLVTFPTFSGDTPIDFWKSANVLNLYGIGHSQQELITLLDTVLAQNLSIRIADCGTASGPYLYFDDFLLLPSKEQNPQFRQNKLPKRQFCV